MSILIPEHWRALALAPPRAFGLPPVSALLRAQPEDFGVEEIPAFEPSGAGEHLLLRVRKRGANTQWVAGRLAQIAGVRPMDVGYAGLKDRNAVTTQWFSVPARKRTPQSWLGAGGGFDAEGFEVQEAHAHARKLARGELAGNRFRILLRDVEGSPAALRARLEEIARRGAPNYFGPQRFGRDLQNLQAALAGAGASRHVDAFALSAARSLVFNAVLAARVRDGSWEAVRAGDLANPDGSNEVHRAAAANPAAPADVPVGSQGAEGATAGAAASLAVHATGPLWGSSMARAQDMLAPGEADIAAGFPELTGFLAQGRVQAARRALRVAVRNCTLDPDAGSASCWLLGFELRSGAFATAVLRELVAQRGAPMEDGDD